MKFKPLLSLAAGAMLLASASGVSAAVAPPGTPSINNMSEGDSLLSLTLEQFSSAKQDYFLLTLTGPAQNLNLSFEQGGVINDVVNASFKLTAFFDPTGALIADGAPVTEGSAKTANNEVKISGKIRKDQPAGKVETQVLWLADVTEVDYSAAPGVLGFGTDNFSGWAEQFSGGLPESVWLAGWVGGTFDGSVLSALNDMFAAGSLSAFSAGDIATIATVPVPAALWLFGSVVPAVVMIRRRAA
ncbi:MAG: hypothetical protein AB7Q97_05130 [Gammaproteobacteria bacterium]